MTELHWQIIQGLRGCTFLPGSWDKRFARDMETLGPCDMLSPKQEVQLERMAWRYRRQIGRALVPPPPKGTVDASVQDLQKLEAWNTGKPLPGGMHR